MQRTVQVGREALITLTQGSLRDPGSIQALEGAAAELYKALQAGRDRGELGGSMLNSVVTCPQIWLLQWSVWRSIEPTTLSSANGCMSTHPSCLPLRCARIHSALQHFTMSKTLFSSRHYFWVIQMGYQIQADVADRKLRVTRI